MLIGVPISPEDIENFPLEMLFMEEVMFADVFEALEGREIKRKKS